MLIENDELMNLTPEEKKRIGIEWGRETEVISNKLDFQYQNGGYIAEDLFNVMEGKFVGDKVTVIWGGVEIETEVKLYEPFNLNYIGNLAQYGMRPETTEPFFASSGFWACLEKPTNNEVGVVREFITKIPPEFLPEGGPIDLSGYAKKSDIPSLEGYAKTTDIPNLDGYAKKTDIPSLEGYAKKSDIPSVPTKVSELQNDSGFLTQHQDLTDYAKKSDIPILPNMTEYAKKTDLPSLDGYAKKTDIPSLEDYAKTENVPTKVSQLQNDSGFLTQHQDLTDYAKKSDIPNLDGYAKKTDIPSLEGYAKKSDIPSVPTKVSELQNDSGFLTQHQDLSDYAKKENIPTRTSDLINDSGFINNTKFETWNFTLADGTTVSKKVVVL